MANRTCIFCGSTGLSLEHVFPQWLAGVLAGDPRKAGAPFTHTRVAEFNGALEGTRWFQSRNLLDFKVRLVCRRCNNEWMNDIENMARPFLTPMIQGVSIELDRPGQLAVAAWASLRAMVARYQHHHESPVPADWRNHMYANHSPPDGWHVWATLYSGDRLLYYAGSDLNPDRAVEYESTGLVDGGIGMTIVVGRLALKVAGPRGARLAAAPGKLAHIWPSTRDIELWPPEIRIADESMLEALVSLRIPFLRP